jgi:hypothetical protein
LNKLLSGYVCLNCTNSGKNNFSICINIYYYSHLYNDRYINRESQT